MRYLPILALSLAACSGPYSEQTASAVGPAEDQPAEVRVERVEEGLIPEIVSANGELYAEEEATLGPKVPGRVAKLYVDLGDTVRAGQKLAELEKSDYEFRLRQAEALVSQTRARLGILDKADDAVTPEETAIVKQAAAELKEARFIFQTTNTLAQEGVLSKIDMEKAGVARDAAEAAYQGALEQVMQLRAELSERRAQLELIKQNLADCEIRAPFDGAVTERIASLGEYLPVNGPVVRVVRQHPLRLRLEVPERSAVRVRTGQRIEVRVEGLSETPAGRVVRISPAIDAASRSLLVEGEIPNPSGVLRPGAFAEGLITVNPDARGIAVARDSVLSFAGVERVFVVAGGKLEDRVVKTGRLLDGDRVEVVEGLESGAQVVRQVSDRLTPGEPARVL
ncbi:MAG: efflux RND transporter periplasmic adaptor subunit [Bryobacterales bacterium]